MCVRRRIIRLLQSQDLDGKPTFEFTVTGWSVNELFCLKAPRGGILLVIAENDRVIWRSTWFVEKEDWNFRLIEFMSLCLEVPGSNGRRRLSIASLWKRSHQEIPPTPFFFLHLIIIPLSLIIPPSLMGVIFISTWKEIFVSESLLRGWIWRSTWFVEKKDWDYRLIEFFCLYVLK